MIINFLYCIDFPAKADNVLQSNRIDGWLLCFHKIIDVRICNTKTAGYHFDYGMLRADVAQHFQEFSANNYSGFRILAEKEALDLREGLELEVVVELSDGISKRLLLMLDLNPSEIKEIEVDDEKHETIATQSLFEQKFKQTLKTHPWLTVRMDITNKCNLKCIMCHYKEQEIYSQPTKAITAEELQHFLHDIAPYVKHIMLSCGFEPLMSKHFGDIMRMLHQNYPHMEIGLCTNGMLLNSKARKIIIENNCSHVILSFDGVKKQTLENIRAGANYDLILSNIMALRDLKKHFKRTFPLLFMDFVLMNSNIEEAVAFVGMCAELGVGIIDFRHLVGNIYFSEHEEMLSNNKAKYNYFRQLIVDESRKYTIDVRLPEPFETEEVYVSDGIVNMDLSDFRNVKADNQNGVIIEPKEAFYSKGEDKDFGFLMGASCLRPFNEIMIIDQKKILPCSYYNNSMGILDSNTSLYNAFFNDAFTHVRQKMMQSLFDYNCVNCPIKLNLLPTEKA